MVSSASSLLVVALVALFMVDCALCQTFSYSRGWKSGKRAGNGGVAGGAAPGAGQVVGGLGPSGRTGDDVLAEDLPLYRYLIEGRREHRVPYDPWHLVDDSVHFARRPPHRDGALPGEQDHDDR